MVLRLVEFLREAADGYEWYRRMGFGNAPLSRNAWPMESVDSLVTALRAWSAKLVQTHFDRLRQHGLITAEREHANGP